jgi:Spy/CpxP family protein refolding chaperone
MGGGAGATRKFSRSGPNKKSVTIMHRGAASEQLKRTRKTIDKLLALLEASEHDTFAAHLHRSRQEYRHVCERPNKGNKAVERTIISTFQIAQSMGFKGEFRQWEHLLRIHE